MADELSDGQRDLNSSLRVEYQIVHQKWRFLHGSRFALAAILGTLQLTLLGVYQTSLPITDGRSSAMEVLIIAPLVALVLLISGAVAERRIFSTSVMCLLRGEEIESLLKIEDGIFARIARMSLVLRVLTVSRTFQAALFAVAVLWVGLLALVLSKL